MEAPFVAEHSGVQRVIAGADAAAYAAHRGHDAVRICELDRHFKRLEVDLAERLLGAVGAETAVCAAVRVLIVERKVLQRRVDAVRLGRANRFGRHQAAHHGILGIVFKVACGVGRAVQVDRRRPPVRRALHGKLGRNEPSEFIGQFLIPRCAEQVFIGELVTLAAGYIVDHALRAVHEVRFGLADAVHRAAAPARLTDEHHRFILGKLI